VPLGLRAADAYGDSGRDADYPPWWPGPLPMSNLLNSSVPTQRHLREVERLFPHLYEGTVEYVSDPMNLGRIKVRVHGVNDPDSQRTPPTSLPWCYPCHAPGSFHVPEVGSTCWVLFRHGLSDYPVYLGVWHGQLKKPVVKGRLPVFSTPEAKPTKNNAADQVLSTYQGLGVPDDLRFHNAVAPPALPVYQILSASGGLANFAAGTSITVQDSTFNNGTFRILTNNGFIMTVDGPLNEEDLSTATIGQILVPPASNNFTSYLEPPGNESPRESYDLKQSIDPTVKVHWQTPKGATAYSVDDDGEERTAIVDRMGQGLHLVGAVTSSANQHNKARRRRQEVRDGTGLPVDQAVDGKASVELYDLLGQFVKLMSDGGGSCIVEIHGKDGASGFFRIAQDGMRITIRSDADSQMVMDESIVMQAQVDGSGPKLSLLSSGVAKLENQAGTASLTLDQSGGYELKNSAGAQVTGSPAGTLALKSSITITIDAPIVQTNGG